MPKKESIKIVTGLRDIELEEHGLIATVDSNDNILKIVRKTGGADLTRTNLPMDVYKALSRKLEANRL